MNEKTKRDDKIQGEGDRESAREYNEATREFIESGKVDEAAKRTESGSRRGRAGRGGRTGAR